MEVVLVLLWIVCGIAAGVIASGRHASGCLWFGLGILFGPFALAFAFMAGPGRQCPKCKSNIPEDATRCPKCQVDLGSGGAQPDAESDRTQRLVDLLKGEGHVATPQYRCPKCKTPALKDAARCTGCGEVFLAGLPTTKKCPDCAEEIKAEARKCRFCGFRFDDEKEVSK